MDELKLECLCKLLTIVGLKFESHLKGLETFNELKKEGGQEIIFDPEHKWFYNIFNKIYDFSRDESLSARIRFALLDLDDLRHNNWKPRHDATTTQTICLCLDAIRNDQQLTNYKVKPKTMGIGSNWRPMLIPQPTSKQIEIWNLKKVELHKAENPWKPKRWEAYTDIKEQIVRQARGILNKLTSNNFDSLVEKFLKLPFENNEERITSVIHVLFEKSINEPLFSTVYAKMVHTICQNSQKISKIFRKKILDLCQIEFQKTSTDEADLKEIEISIAKTNEEFLKEELEEKFIQRRRRSLGNVRFIGELYKLQMITPRIMIDCATMLLSMDEENLECLCKLLTTVGLRLEEQIKDVEISNELKRKGGQVIKYAPEPKWFDKTFNKIYDLSQEESISFRIRFLLLDVFELRQNNWKPNAPKTIDEICRAVIRQEQEEMRQINSLLMSTVQPKSRDYIKKPNTDSESFGLNPKLNDQAILTNSASGSQSPFIMTPTTWGNMPSIQPIYPNSPSNEKKSVSPSANDKIIWVVNNIFDEYCISKNLADTIEWIKERFKGDSINQFIEILSRQTAEESKVEKQIAAGILINSLISNKVVTKESVIKNLQEGLLLELSEIRAGIPKV